VINNLDLHLSAMGMASEAELDAKIRSAPEGIRIVRKQNVRHVAADERFDLAQHVFCSRMLAADHVITLIVNAEQVKPRAIMLDHCVGCP